MGDQDIHSEGDQEGDVQQAGRDIISQTINYFITLKQPENIGGTKGFLSYSRSDRPFAWALYQRLADMGLHIEAPDENAGEMRKLRAKTLWVLITLLLLSACATSRSAPQSCLERDLSAMTSNQVSRNAGWKPCFQEFDGVTMALVPAGCFMMGSEDGDSDEQPVHEVCFEEPFWIDVYEVTNEQYGSLGCELYSSDPAQPHNCISWVSALAHCEARGARLPTEAEWEYAARGPDGLVYPWGNRFDAGNVTNGDFGKFAWNVGSKPGGVSWIGAYDLSGNVWEWVNDWYLDTYYSTLEDGVINPQGPDIGEVRVARGGSWDADSFQLRSAHRSGFLPGSFYGGFRCALSWQP